MKKVVTVLLVIVMIVAVVGCSNIESHIVGRWANIDSDPEHPGYVWEFNDDGTGEYKTGEGTTVGSFVYEINGKNVVLTYQGTSGTIQEFIFDGSKERLNLKEGMGVLVVLTKIG